VAYATEDEMSSPDELRAKAAKAREVAGKGKRGPNGYLLELADRYEAEAGEMERRRGLPPLPEAPKPRIGGMDVP
jgi:hypothetical protein